MPYHSTWFSMIKTVKFFENLETRRTRGPFAVVRYSSEAAPFARPAKIRLYNILKQFGRTTFNNSELPAPGTFTMGESRRVHDPRLGRRRWGKWRLRP
jgi:hypothetical protein